MKRSRHEKKEHANIPGPEEKNLNLDVESLQGVKEPVVSREEKETNFLVYLKEGREYQKNWQSKC